jgi:hypothetical protein
MTASTSLAEATTRLSEWISKKPNRAAEQKAALDHYGNLFRPENLPNLSEEDFKAFLLLENNKHWSNINRHPSI